MIIKGRSLAHHALRPEQSSADVDLLVDPAKLFELDSALRKDGWVRREERFRGQWDAPHSRTFVHPEWPCDIDVHWFFPGFLADPSVVFDELWSRSTRMPVAHNMCPVPDIASSAMILLLNRVRNGGSSSPTPKVEDWARSLTADGRDDVKSLVARAGCEVTLARPLGDLELLPGSELVDRAEQSRRRDRAATGRHGYVFWSLSHRGADLLSKLRAVVILVTSGATGRGYAVGVTHARRVARGARRALGRQQQTSRSVGHRPS